MATSDNPRADLERLVLDFTDCFNQDDLDGVMAYFAEDSVYDEFNGARSEGKAAIRAAFEPQFRGDFGTIRFHQEDLILDPDAGKALISWTCSLDRPNSNDGSHTASHNAWHKAWRGLDILHFRDGKLTVKQTYAKADKPRLT
jgi:ketosteroid isomerase-like protein